MAMNGIEIASILECHRNSMSMLGTALLPAMPALTRLLF
jgi:hypothetical protein